MHQTPTTTTRAMMLALLIAVASAAAVLSFSSLRDLAAACGFRSSLAWLLPVVIDAGAAAGCLVWIRWRADSARRFARTLTWVLLASSVAGNGVVHYLGAYGLQPAWLLVVAVSAVAPAVLGAVVHLAVLVAQPPADQATVAGTPAPIPDGGEDLDEDDEITRARELVAAGRAKGPYGRGQLAEDLGVKPWRARQILEIIDGDTSMRLVL